MEPLKSTGGTWVLPMQRLEVLMEQVESEMKFMSVELLRKIVERMSPSQRQAIAKLNAAIQFEETWGE